MSRILNFEKNWVCQGNFHQAINHHYTPINKAERSVNINSESTFFSNRRIIFYVSSIMLSVYMAIFPKLLTVTADNKLCVIPFLPECWIIISHLNN